MNKLFENWRKFLVESEDRLLGKYVWPTANKYYGGLVDEPDTDIEEMLYQQLHNHFGAIAPMSDEAIEVLKQILDSGQYSNVFRRVKSGTALRGIRLPLSWLEEHAPEALANLPTERKDGLDWGEPESISPMTYKPEGKYKNVSSWTPDWRTARSFTTMAVKNTLPVILHTSMDSGYFMSTAPFKAYKGGRYRADLGIKKLNPNAHEKEIILIGECLVTAVQIYATQQEVETMALRSSPNWRKFLNKDEDTTE